MTNISNSLHENATHDASPDPFEAALDVLRSAGVGFDVVGDFRRIDTGYESFERAA